MDKNKWHIFTKSQYIYFTIVAIMALIIMAIISLWTIDISISAMIVDGYTTETMKLTNGFFLKDPMKAYHMGLWGVIFSMFFLSCITVHAVTRSIKSEE